MNRLFIFHFFLLLTTLTYAKSDTSRFQLFDKGKNIAGIQLSGGWGGGRVVVHTQLRYGHFFLKKLNTGLETGFSTNGIYYNAVNFRPYIRYYILNKKFAPFVETNYAYGFSTQSNGYKGTLGQEWKSTSNSVFIGGGLAYSGLLERFGIELYGGYFYSSIFIKDNPIIGSHRYDKDGFAYGLRINLHFFIDK